MCQVPSRSIRTRLVFNTNITILVCCLKFYNANILHILTNEIKIFILFINLIFYAKWHLQRLIGVKCIKIILRKLAH